MDENRKVEILQDSLRNRDRIIKNLEDKCAEQQEIVGKLMEFIQLHNLEETFQAWSENANQTK